MNKTKHSALPSCNAHEDLLQVCRDHNLMMGRCAPHPNPCGTFSDALLNLAAELPVTDRMNGWAEWLRKKAFALDAAVRKAEQQTSLAAEAANQQPEEQR